MAAIIPTIPSEWRQWKLCLPDDIAWKALATGLVRHFCYRYFWDAESGDIDTVLAKGQEILLRWKDQECEDDPICTLISDAIDAALQAGDPDIFFTHILDYVTEHCLGDLIDAFTDFYQNFLCFQLSHLFGTEATLSQAVSLFGACGVNIVGYISGVRINGCNLEYQLSGSATWNNGGSIEDCVKDTINQNPPQPGAQGTLDPDECKIVDLVVPGNGRALIPGFTDDAGITVEVLQVTGAWSPDAALGALWYCPDGKDYFLGACTTGPVAASGTYPLPSGNKFEVIITGVDAWPARVNEPVTLQDGGSYYLQMNDPDISNNQGSVSVRLKVCKPSCGQAEDIVTFDATNNVTWEAPNVALVASNGLINADRSAIIYSVQSGCWVRVTGAELVSGTDAVNHNTLICPSGSEAGDASDPMTWFASHTKIHSSYSMRHNTGDYNNFSYRLTFLVVTCP